MSSPDCIKYEASSSMALSLAIFNDPKLHGLKLASTLWNRRELCFRIRNIFLYASTLGILRISRGVPPCELTLNLHFTSERHSREPGNLRLSDAIVITGEGWMTSFRVKLLGLYDRSHRQKSSKSKVIEVL